MKRKPGWRVVRRYSFGGDHAFFIGDEETARDRFDRAVRPSRGQIRTGSVTLLDAEGKVKQEWHAPKRPS